MKKAIMYTAVLPSAYVLEDILREFKHQPIHSSSISQTGFCIVTTESVVDEDDLLYVNLISDQLFMFKMRIDEKIIPSTMVKEQLNSRVAKIERTELRNVTKKEKDAIKDDIIMSIVPTAPYRTKIVTALYNVVDHSLFIEGSDSQAGTLLALLRKGMGSLKTTTIHVDTTNSLSDRLHNLLEADNTDALGNFNVGCKVVLKCNEGKDKVSIATDGTPFDETVIERDTIIMSLDENYHVDQLELVYQNTKFTLDSRFTLKGIKYDEEYISERTGDEYYDDVYAADNAKMFIRTQALLAIKNELCKIFDYKEESE